MEWKRKLCYKQQGATLQHYKVCAYLVNDPEYYDEKGNSNGKKNVDGQNQGVKCGILQAGTKDRRKAGHVQIPLYTRIPSSKSDNYREGWQDKSHNHRCDVDVL